MNHHPFAGVYPPLPTPFSHDGALAPDHLAALVRRLNSSPITGYVVLGSNGEAPLLTESERLRVIETVCQEATGKRVIVGTGMESTAATRTFTAKAAQAGAEAALVITPSYYKPAMTAEVLLTHFRAIAESSPLPIFLYNMPANTGIDLSAETILELATHPNIVGVKDSSGNLVKLAEVCRSAPADFEVFAGSASFFLPALLIGAVGVVAALANIAPALVCQVQALFQRQELANARTAQQQILAPNAAVTSRFGVSGLKAALDLCGCYGGPPRPPLLPLTVAQRALLRDTLNSAGILPTEDPESTW